MVMDQQQQPQQQVYKHYCRVCKKGFGCGRALGGHMRAHGINDDTLGGHADTDDDPASSEWDDKLNPPGGHKRMYALRTNPNRLKSCRVCENCGKEFLSWKSFLEHGKCSAGEDAGDDSLGSSPRSDADADDPVRGCAGWSKGKRSRRAKAIVPLCPSSEEEIDLANCLVMLSAARVDPMLIVEPEESCASASKEEDRRQHPITITATTDRSKAPAPPSPAVPRGMFECKACKKVFSSHQALGGHRASHKKVKGCFAAKLDDLDEAPLDDEISTHDNNTTSEMAMAIVPFSPHPPVPPGPDPKPLPLHPLVTDDCNPAPLSSLIHIQPTPQLKTRRETESERRERDITPLIEQPQQQVYKHYCRVCKKGFGCGRALGGHMRAHGINDDTLGGHADTDDDPASSEWDDKLNPPGGHKRMYALRTNPNRLKSCRVCENCGKEFLSWKSFLEHGKCSAGEDAGDDSLGSSPRSDADADDPVRGCAGWSKGKRSRRAKAIVPLCPSSEEEIDLANCLVMLSAARVDPMLIVEPEESCASASKEEDRRQHPITITATTDRSKAPAPPSPAVPRGMFECKACKKVFSSHQALGGHRASHKKVKGCFAAKLDDLDEAPLDDEISTHDNNTTSEMAMAIVPFDNPPLAVTPLKKKSKVHECSICHRVFTSGQALGGHKRCHWITSSAPDAAAVAKLHPLPPDHAAAGLHPQLTLRPMFESSDTLDLNLPAPVEEDLGGVRQDVGSPLPLDMPAALYLKPWIDQSNTNTNIDKNKATSSSNNNINNNNNNVNSSRDHNDEAITNGSVDEEADSKVKLAKLSDLKDINMGGESAPWLQVGIGSSTNEGSEP
ncbi:putative Zinc finger protein ZAT10 [Cocos nucifera]|uniref:Putative Zinc finger protein ZAT10 n=1 Tax=Cocos nucifera TaxID=13894 RepID=A0A8K0N7K4_COCNU|nr:putative Zinc finger protein ZAT10 [Cocos nucifera]